jgi:DNA-directed RNA polymerase specialized sigma subunit
MQAEHGRSAFRERELWRRMHAAGDSRAREELIEVHMPMAQRMAARYAGVAEPFDDLRQVASLGLVNAVDRFRSDPRRPLSRIRQADDPR